MAPAVIFKMLTLNILTLVVLLKFTWGQDISQLLIGGEDAVENEFPWAARLIYNSKQKCGAVIISPLWLLTAGHCAIYYNMELYVVEAGSVNINSPDMKRYSLTEKIIHPEYLDKGAYIENDIALLRSNAPLLPEGAEPISMDTNGEELQDNPMGVIAGWGFIRASGALPEILKKIQLPLLTDEQCSEIHGGGYVPTMMICAGSTQWKDICYGDGGSGFVVEGILRGIVSTGHYPCAEGPKYAPIFSHVQNFLGWINEVIAAE